MRITTNNHCKFEDSRSNSVSVIDWKQFDVSLTKGHRDLELKPRNLNTNIGHLHVMTNNHSRFEDARSNRVKKENLARRYTRNNASCIPFIFRLEDIDTINKNAKVTSLVTKLVDII